MEAGVDPPTFSLGSRRDSVFFKDFQENNSVLRTNGNNNLRGTEARGDRRQSRAASLDESHQSTANSDFKPDWETMAKHNPKNERIKRQYLAYLIEASGRVSRRWTPRR
jgi:hypothetical protein